MNEPEEEMLRKRKKDDKSPQHHHTETHGQGICAPGEFKIPVLFVAIGVIVTWFTFYTVALYLTERLPPLLAINDHNNEDRFIGEKSKKFLGKLALLGVKVPGSRALETNAIDLLREEISNIVDVSKRSINQISFDHQVADGSFFLAKPFNHMSVYNKINNLLVRIGPSERSDANGTSSLLVNCHFDTAPSSPGASDDGLNCAVMLEVLRVLSKKNCILNHSIIFLFNGAEETILQASHAFITQHKWAKSVKVFINLESCGAGGKELLFQTGPQHPWLVQMYKEAAVHPFGFVLGEEIFQSGLVPSATDFQIFRDFGHIPGLDFAHYDNGYVYHTSLDDVGKIKDGVYQNTGDNILGLVQHISTSSILDSIEEHQNGRKIYFDLFGLYFVTYSETFAFILNSAVIIMSLYTVVCNNSKYTKGLKRLEVGKQILVCNWIPLLGLILSLVFVLCIAIILDFSGSTLSWYSKTYLIIPIYAVPTAIAFILPIVLLNRTKHRQFNDVLKSKLYCNGVQLMWTIGLLITTSMRVRSAYILLIAVIFTGTTNFVLMLMNLQCNGRTWLYAFLSANGLPSLYFMYLFVITTKVFVPIAGRSGPGGNPEIVIGFLTCFIYSLIFSYVAPLILLVSKPWRIIYGLLIIHIVALFAVIFTPFGFPFTEDAPQRITTLYVDRKFFNETGDEIKTDSGMWLPYADRYEAKTFDVMPWFKNVKDIDSDCKTFIFCGLPSSYKNFKTNRILGSWVPAPPPLVEVDVDTNLRLTSVEHLASDPNTKRFHFTSSGPHQMVFYLCPKKDVLLLNWSFEKARPVKNKMWIERPVYVIRYTAGGYSDVQKLNFYVDLEITSKSNLSAYLDIAVSGHYIEDFTTHKTELMRNFTSFVKWAHITTWTVSYRSYVF